MDNFISLPELVGMVKEKTILLPTVQRGFVWKPYQVENLWDSLLRGYPIGSFVLSKKSSSSQNFELLDGQQRASAICLGFYDPPGALNNDASPDLKVFRTSYESIMIFIDLMKPDHNKDNRKYIIRVITKSHPWGYRKQNNQKVLESGNIAKAMEAYGVKGDDYLKKPLREFWPFDAHKPIPLGEDLLPKAQKKIKNLFEETLNLRLWKTEVGKREERERRVYFLSMERKELCLYFSFRNDDDAILENEIYFGICERQGDNIIEAISIPKNKVEVYESAVEGEHFYIGHWFTLLSASEYSIRILFGDILFWIKDFPDEEIRKLAVRFFDAGIKEKYRDEISNPTELV